jgi:hypothetical protein
MFIYRLIVFMLTNIVMLLKKESEKTYFLTGIKGKDTRKQITAGSVRKNLKLNFMELKENVLQNAIRTVQDICAKHFLTSRRIPA